MKKTKVLIIMIIMLITVNSLIFADNANNFKVTVDLQPYIEVQAPADISFAATVGTDTKSSPAAFRIKANTPISVSVSSTGFNKTLNKYVSYAIGNYGTLTPGKNIANLKVKDRSYKGNFVVNWNGIAFKEKEDWSAIDAAAYTDTITFTVSAQ